MYVDDVMNLLGGLDWLGINYYRVKWCFIVFIVLMFFLLIMCILVNFD